MKKIILVSLTTILMAACGEKTSTKSEPSMKDEHAAATPKEEAPLAAVKFDFDRDPVCGMPTSGGMGDSSRYNGKLYGFCCSGCKEDFVADPAGILAKAEKK